MRRWRSNPKNREAERARVKQTGRARRANHKYLYGLTYEERDALLRAQGGKCAICDTALYYVVQPDGIVRPPAKNADGMGRTVIDHCHKTGKVRGLLCTRCNLMLGHGRDDPGILKKALAYLERAG